MQRAYARLLSPLDDGLSPSGGLVWGELESGGGVRTPIAAGYWSRKGRGDSGKKVQRVCNSSTCSEEEAVEENGMPLT